MHDVITVYRGYAIYLSLGLNWSFIGQRPSHRTGQSWRAPNGETGTPNWALTVKTTVPISCTPLSRKISTPSALLSGAWFGGCQPASNR
jgi:hypothetical protein